MGLVGLRAICSVGLCSVLFVSTAGACPRRIFCTGALHEYLKLAIKNPGQLYYSRSGSEETGDHGVAPIFNLDLFNLQAVAVTYK